VHCIQKHNGYPYYCILQIPASSKQAPWGGPKLYSFFSFIGVGVAVEVRLPWMGDRQYGFGEGDDDVYDPRAIGWGSV